MMLTGTSYPRNARLTATAAASTNQKISGTTTQQQQQRQQQRQQQQRQQQQHQQQQHQQQQQQQQQPSNCSYDMKKITSQPKQRTKFHQPKAATSVAASLVQFSSSSGKRNRFCMLFTLLIIICYMMYSMLLMLKLYTCSYTANHDDFNTQQHHQQHLLLSSFHSRNSHTGSFHRNIDNYYYPNSKDDTTSSTRMTEYQIQHILSNIPTHNGNILIIRRSTISVDEVNFWLSTTTDGTIYFLILLNKTDSHHVQQKQEMPVENHPLHASKDFYIIPHYISVNKKVTRIPTVLQLLASPEQWSFQLTIPGLPSIFDHVIWNVILMDDAAIVVDDSDDGGESSSTANTNTNTNMQITHQMVYMTKALVDRSIQLIHTTNRATTYHPIHVFLHQKYHRNHSSSSSSFSSLILQQQFQDAVFEHQTPLRVIRSSSSLSASSKFHSNPNHQTTLVHYLFYPNDDYIEQQQSTPKVGRKQQQQNSGHDLVGDDNNDEEVKQVKTATQKIMQYRHLYNEMDENHGQRIYITRSKNDSIQLKLSTVLHQDNITTTQWEYATKAKAMIATTSESLQQVSSSTLQIDAPIQILKRKSRKPVLAIITSSRSPTKRFASVYETLLYQHLIISIINTVTPTEQELWDIHLYVAIDDDDDYWKQHWHEMINIPEWIQFQMIMYPNRPSRIPFNEVALSAYNDGADYFVRVNDDTEFISDRWITIGVTTLLNYDPPNIGVVGPKCEEGNIHIMTHDMVHRTHFHIFRGYYYPPVFGNWFLDDWMTNVYSSSTLGPRINYSTVIDNWIVRHWRYETRYAYDGWDVLLLPSEYNKGRKYIKEYIIEHYPNHSAIDLINDTVERPHLMNDQIVNSILDVLPPNGNILIFGVSSDGQFWNSITSGRVVFIDDASIKSKDVISSLYPYLYIYSVKYPTYNSDYYHQLILKYDLYNSSFKKEWCNFTIPGLKIDELLGSYWDVILIDHCFTNDHRCDKYDSKSILPMAYTAKQLLINNMKLMFSFDQIERNRTTHIFVDKQELSVERKFINHVFMNKEPNTIAIMESSTHVNTTREEMAHFRFLGYDKVLANMSIPCLQ